MDITFRIDKALSTLPGVGKLWMRIGPRWRDHIVKAPIAFLMGVMGALIGWGILWFLTDYAGWFYLISAVVATFVNVSVNFVANDRVTFKGVGTGKHWFRRYIEFWTTYGLGAAIDFGFIALYTSVVKIDYRISWWLAAATVGTFRYLGMYYWVWRKKKIA